MNAFDLKAIHYVTKQGKVLLDDVSVSIPSCKLTAFLGANGAGKSTLLRHLFGHYSAHSGEVCFESTPISSMTAQTKAQKIAWLGQEVAHDVSLTVEEFVLLGRRACLGALRSPSPSDWALVHESLKMMDVEHLAKRRFAFLSGGERQRAAIAQVLTQNTSTILMDEPTNHLDLRHRHLLLKHLKTVVAQGKTVVTVLHDLDLVARYADFVVLLEHGRVRAAGNVVEVMTGEHLSAAYQWPMRVVNTGSELGVRIEVD